MRLSVKWMTLPILAGAAGALTFAFASGCTVTSGTVDNTEGGTTSPPETPPGTPPPPPAGDDGGDAGATCEPNAENAQNRADIGADCQSCLDTSCCSQLKGCFNLAPGDTDAGTAASDCNAYAHCIIFCDNDFAQDAGGDAGAVMECEAECAASTSDAITAAYNDLLTCRDTSCQAHCK